MASSPNARALGLACTQTLIKAAVAYALPCAVVLLHVCLLRAWRQQLYHVHATGRDAFHAAWSLPAAGATAGYLGAVWLGQKAMARCAPLDCSRWMLVYNSYQVLLLIAWYHSVHWLMHPASCGSREAESRHLPAKFSPTR